jgi:hypothetical protein
MHRILLSSASALVLATLVATGSPAFAQTVTVLPDVTLEGPIQSFPATGAETVPTTTGVGLDIAGKPIVGTIKVMGITVKVAANAAIHTPTKENLSWAQFATGAFPGRSEPGFLGGTAHVAGDSVNGTIYARDVFSDMLENVVVGEATGVNPVTGNITLQGMDLMKSTDERMPFKEPVNIYGFPIDTNSITPGTLVSAEGYYTTNGDALRYHTLEADSAALLIATPGPQVSILRADCRIRGRNRDEISIRGGVHTPNTGQVAISYSKVLEPDPRNAAHWTAIGNSGNAIPDPATAVPGPAQGEYRFDSTRLNLGGSCPTQVRATFNGAIATAVPESR